MYLKIQSQGEVVPEALTLMGASTKRDDENTIGMFGTGNKYALATLLRNGIDVRIYSGKKLLKIEQEDVTLKDQTFKRMVIGGNKTSITTALGKDWKVWMAIREFYANAIDEGMTVFNVIKSPPSGKEGFTTVFVEMNAEMNNFWFNRKNYFSKDKTVLFKSEMGNILEKSSPETCVYRMGIRALETEERSLFDYDLTNRLVVNEDRLAKYQWDIYEHIWRIMYECEDEMLIQMYAANFESNVMEFNYSGWFSTYPQKISEAWKKFLTGKKIASTALKNFVSEDEKHEVLFIHDRFYNDLICVLPEEELKRPESLMITDAGVGFSPYEMSETEKELLDRAKKFFKDVGFFQPYEIRVVEFQNPRQLGGVDGKKILLGHRNMTRGKHEIVNTIIEEYIHIKHKVKDETRAFQTAAIDELVTFMDKVRHDLQFKK